MLIDAKPVQPRVCGERPPLTGAVRINYGSAPRVRGTRPRSGPRFDRRRFSPACAGNALPNHSTLSPHAVQPRVCGERPHTAEQGLRFAGSAPRVRGTPGTESGDNVHERFSPACAGNACARGTASARRSVQPRVCGERALRRRGSQALIGSAPRVRGTRQETGERDGRFRFSPACAGNASTASANNLEASVQPRVCGERLRTR